MVRRIHITGQKQQAEDDGHSREPTVFFPRFFVRHHFIAAQCKGQDNAKYAYLKLQGVSGAGAIVINQKNPP